MKKILLLAVSGLMIQHASAQLSIAPEAGFQMTNIKAKMGGTDWDYKMKAGFRAGLNLDMGITNNIHLQAGLFYSAKGAKLDDVNAGLLTVKGGTTKLNYLEVPVYVNYMTGEAGGNRFFVGVGPYLGYALSAKYEDTKIEIGTEKGKDGLKPIDFGANVNVGYMLSNGLYARANYSLGLSNTFPGGDSDNSQKNNGFAISLGYNFNL